MRWMDDAADTKMTNQWIIPIPTQEDSESACSRHFSTFGIAYVSTRQHDTDDKEEKKRMTKRETLHPVPASGVRYHSRLTCSSFVRYDVVDGAKPKT